MFCLFFEYLKRKNVIIVGEKKESSDTYVGYPKQNQQKNIEKEPLFNFQSIDEYLHGLVKSKSIFSLCLLVLINIAVVYIPYGATLKIWLKDIPIVLKSIIKAFVYTGPIVVVFCYLFRDVMKELFQKCRLDNI